MKTMRHGLGLVLALALMASAGRADAAGLLLDANELPAPTRTTLAREIAAARAATPELFRQVHEVAARAEELDAASRLRGAPLTRHLKALGPRALMPMLEMLAFDAHAPADLTPTARAALRVGLLEAIGIVRDARAIPVLARVLDRERDLDHVRASAEALSRIGTDVAIAAVTSALSAAKDDAGRERAILTGLGDARRESVARLLAARLDAGPEESTARVLARSLGGVGNAWAWRTMSSRSEEAASREIAARALLRAFLRYSGETRKAAEKALLVVDAPQTPALVAEARRAANADTAPALDALAARLAKNPAR